LASSLKKWVKKKKPFTQQLNDIENELSIIQQDPPHLIDHVKEENLIQQHNLITDKITNYYRQISKKHWATKGDRNTKFFQHACSRRRRKNRILFIHNNSGQAFSSLKLLLMSLSIILQISLPLQFLCRVSLSIMKVP
jgi:hypothetical protein